MAYGGMGFILTLYFCFVAMGMISGACAVNNAVAEVGLLVDMIMRDDIMEEYHQPGEKN